MARRILYARVWPLKPGLIGVDIKGNPIELPLWQRGRMEVEEAKRLEAEGKLQLAAGKGTHELKTPSYETATAKPAEAPEDLDSVVDEETASSPSSTPPPVKKKVVARKKRYSRRDMQAEQN